jgi:predicted DsbA family dithiol-disulfide isomerase
MVTAAEGVIDIASIVAPMRVKIFQDLVCPWCYIGKSRFDEALKIVSDSRPELQIELSFGPYQLDPTAPEGEAKPVIEAYAAKFGGIEKAKAILERVTEAAHQAGLEMNMDIAKRANTGLAHRLLLAAAPTNARILLDGLYRAYFVEGMDIADRPTLRILATAAGMDTQIIDEVLTGDFARAQLDDELKFAHDAGITAVPTFVFEGQWAVSGAQDPEFFVRVLNKLADA